MHYGIVRYGTDPTDLSQTAKNPIRLNQSHPDTTFRLRMEGLKPRTTYYYRVSSEESNGQSDGVKSAVNKFTTPGPWRADRGLPETRLRRATEQLLRSHAMSHCCEWIGVIHALAMQET